MPQKASHVFMVRPVRFGYNEETAFSNAFQKKDVAILAEKIQEDALKEFDNFTSMLESEGIKVTVVQDTFEPHTPDSIFPNNWISFHDEGHIVLYPMLAENRRMERRLEIIEKFNQEDLPVTDLSHYEQEDEFLEGTGSVVFDYENKIAYANLSPRTSRKLFSDLCNRLNYKAISFKAIDTNGVDIYHTNVLLTIGSSFALLCTAAIPDHEERKMVVASLENSGHEIIGISPAQMNSFAGNMYSLYNNKLENVIVMSDQAWRCLNEMQLAKLKKYGKILHPVLDTIERYGGGSARCMMADIRT